MTDSRNEIKQEEKPHPVQGLRYFPIYDDKEYTSRTTLWIKFLKQNPQWSDEVNAYLKQAAKKNLYQQEQAYKPAIGDIVFFDGQNEGSAIIAMGNEMRYGIPGTGHFTHVSIVVDIDEATGTALIAEAGGGGIAYMRQSTIRDMQTGHVFRPADREFAYHYVQIALDATKFSVGEYINNIMLEAEHENQNLMDVAKRLAAMIVKMIKRENISENEVFEKIQEKMQALGADDANTLASATALVIIQYDADKSWKQRNYEAVFSAPYSIAGMLSSPALEHFNQQSLLDEPSYDARHRSGFRHPDSKIADTDYKPWCSRFVMQALAAAYVEKLNHDSLGKLPFPKEADQWVNEAFGENISKDVRSLRYIAPKSLYHVLSTAMDANAEPLFKRIGCWVNLDDKAEEARVVNFRYNGGQANQYGARPFLNSTFAFKYDGKPRKEVCKDGVTIEPNEVSSDKSFAFIKLKVDAMKNMRQYHHFLGRQLTAKAHYKMSLYKAVGRLLHALNKTTHPDDMMLVIAEYAFVYGNMSSKYPMPTVKISPLDDFLNTMFEKKKTLELHISLDKVLLGTTEDELHEYSSSMAHSMSPIVEDDSDEESTLSELSDEIIGEIEFLQPNRRSESKDSRSDSSLFPSSTEETYDSHSSRFFKSLPPSRSLTGTPGITESQEEVEYSSLQAMEECMSKLNELRGLIENNADIELISTLKKLMYTQFLDMYANEITKETDELGIATMVKSEILSAIEMSLLDFSQDYPAHPFCSPKNEDKIDLALIENMAKEPFAAELMDVYWNKMLDALKFKHESAFLNLITGLGHFKLERAWNEFVIEQAEKMPLIAQVKVRDALSYHYEVDDKKFIPPSEGKRLAAYNQLSQDPHLTAWFQGSKSSPNASESSQPVSPISPHR